MINSTIYVAVVVKGSLPPIYSISHGPAVFIVFTYNRLALASDYDTLVTVHNAPVIF